MSGILISTKFKKIFLDDRRYDTTQLLYIVNINYKI